MWIDCLEMMPVLRGIVGQPVFCKNACSTEVGPHCANFNKRKGARGRQGRGFRRNNTLFFWSVATGLYKTSTLKHREQLCDSSCELRQRARVPHRYHRCHRTLRYGAAAQHQTGGASRNGQHGGNLGWRWQCLDAVGGAGQRRDAHQVFIWRDLQKILRQVMRGAGRVDPAVFHLQRDIVFVMNNDGMEQRRTAIQIEFRGQRSTFRRARLRADARCCGGPARARGYRRRYCVLRPAWTGICAPPQRCPHPGAA